MLQYRENRKKLGELTSTTMSRLDSVLAVSLLATLVHQLALRIAPKQATRNHVISTPTDTVICAYKFKFISQS